MDAVGSAGALPQGAKKASRLLAVFWVGLAGWSLWSFIGDRLERRVPESFARTFTLDRRRPLEIAAMRLEPSADGAAAVAVDAALEDAFDSPNPNPKPASGELSPELAKLWKDSAERRGAELEAALTLALDAVRTRPGWAPYRFLLGQTAYALFHRRATSTGANMASWRIPLELAAVGAPGLDPVPTFFAGASVESWRDLSPQDRRATPALLRRAFLDPLFVERTFLTASALVGEDAAVGLLPDSAGSLRAASEALAASGDITRAASLRPRLDQARRREREEKLKAIEVLRAAGDLENARGACNDFIWAYPAWDFDDAEGRAQTARLLALWPQDAAGAWRSDSRGDIVRFFLNYREKDARPEDLLATVETLSGVPNTVLARVRLLAGDVTGADEVMRRAGGGGTFEWVPFHVAVARQRLAKGDAQGARQALQAISASGAEACEALLVRREIAAALGDDAEAALVRERLRWFERESLPAESWSEGGMMSLCLDAGERRLLRVDVEADAPALVRYGRDGGRLGTVLVPRGPSRLAIPFSTVAGRHIVSIAAEAGGPIRLGAATLTTQQP